MSGWQSSGAAVFVCAPVPASRGGRLHDTSASDVGDWGEASMRAVFPPLNLGVGQAGDCICMCEMHGFPKLACVPDGMKWPWQLQCWV